jgi:D-alanyl-D-alanine carboxypeptidase/D-alanyl-D-alanine-endopeptidase (penicillin-binding protein 4)
MKYSNNAIAEALLKGLATRTGDSVGSWTGGVAAMRQELSELGVAGEGVVLLDGSGLAPGNRVTARALLSALCVARSSFAFGPELVASLPIAGSDGTLANRSPRTGMIRAKTGLLSGVVGLSGYAARDGDEVAFSILVNGYDVGDDQMMRAVDEVANALSGALSRSAGE